MDDANREIRYRLALDKERQTPTTGQLAEGSAPSTSEGARAVPALSDLAQSQGEVASASGEREKHFQPTGQR
jgi:hypothetical protein